MIANRIAYWRATMNGGKGVSQAHLARKVHVGRSFVTKLEKGKAQPSAKLMLRMARYFKQPVEAVFQLADGTGTRPVFIGPDVIPIRHNNNRSLAGSFNFPDAPPSVSGRTITNTATEHKTERK